MLLCSECDLRSQTCGIASQTPCASLDHCGEEEHFYQKCCDRRARKQQQQQQYFCRQLQLEKGLEDSPVPQCSQCAIRSRCPYCELSENQKNLICFNCHADQDSSTSFCTCSSGERHSTDDSDDAIALQLANIRIRVNNHSIDEDSDDTTSAETAAPTLPARFGIERLATILEAKNSDNTTTNTTASENDEDDPKKRQINGTSQKSFLDYMIVLIL